MSTNTTPPRPALIRDLSTEEFASRYGADRFTATVLGNRFRYIVEHVCGRLLTAAFSPSCATSTTSRRPSPGRRRSTTPRRR